MNASWSPAESREERLLDVAAQPQYRNVRWLNYHHLFYFHSVARAGSIAAAARRLRVAHSTLSVQIRELGEALGGPLFEKRGRRLVLTARGETVLGYADEIFRLGNELIELADEPERSQASRSLTVGVVPSLPRSLVYRLLEGAFSVAEGHVLVRTRSYAALLDELTAGRLHAIIADAPPEATHARTKLFTHMLGRSSIALYAAPSLARTLVGPFPGCLAKAPMILPAPGVGLRRLVDRWLSAHSVRPRVTIEVEDAAMMRTVGTHGHGVFPVRMALRAETEDALGAQRVGELDGLDERYYVVTTERRVRHPLVSTMLERARTDLGSPG